MAMTFESATVWGLGVLENTTGVRKVGHRVCRCQAVPVIGLPRRNLVRMMCE